MNFVNIFSDAHTTEPHDIVRRFMNGNRWIVIPFTPARLLRRKPNLVKVYKFSFEYTCDVIVIQNDDGVNIQPARILDGIENPSWVRYFLFFLETFFL